MNDVFDLANFDSYREDNRLEVKSASGGLPQTLWETYSSMANTYGGVIICGVKERKDHSWCVTGLDNTLKLKKEIWDILNNRNKVSVNLLKESDVETYTVDGHAVLVIHVPAADREHKPVYLNNDMFKYSFKRNHEGDYHCTAEEVRAMIRDEARVTTDAKVLPHEEISDLDQESINSYRVWFGTRHPDHAWTKLGDEVFLEMIGAARKADDNRLHPTCAGLLMFGQEHRIVYEYPSFFLDYRDHADPSVRWTDRIQSQSPDWSGNVFDFYTIVSRKLGRLLNVPFKLVNTVRVDDTPLHNAVREALVNCLVNADYFLARGVVIESYPDRIVLKNPGTSIVGKRQMLRGGESEPRNVNIMKMFNLLGFGEHAGSGVPDIYSVWDDAGYLAPVIEECFGEDGPSKTIVTLPLTYKETFHHHFHHQGDENGDDKSDELELRKQAILELLRKNPNLSIEKMTLALQLTKRQVERTLSTLKSEGKIVRQGSARSGQWIVTD